MDLLTLDRAASDPLYRQLYWALRSVIEDRTLPAGFEVPSTRTLAGDLGIARNTVVATYDQLVTEGFLLSRLGARSVVVALPVRPTPPQSAASQPLRRAVSARGETMMQQPVHHGTPGRFAFHPGMPDARSFPYRDWSRLVAKRAGFGETLFGTYHVAGLPALREAIAAYLRVARGVHCSAEQVVVTTGAQATFDLLARLLLDSGDSVWMEEPGYFGAQSAFVAAGARLVGLPVGINGWRLDWPSPPPRLVFVTPACQHPFGVTMPIEQRLRLLEIAEQCDAWVIEDDYDGEYRFQGRPIPALQCMDRSGRVIYAGTFAKMLFPALRLGFMVLPQALHERMPRALSTTGQFAPLLLQAAVADFINEGLMTRHLKRMRRIYAARRRQFYELCESNLSGRLRLLPGDAGIQVVGLLNEGVDDNAVAATAEELGVNVSPLSKYYRHGQPTHGLVLGYAACDETQMRHGIQRLGKAIAAHLQ